MGIIGLGAFGVKILNPISLFHSKEELQVVAVCDLDAKKAQMIAEQYHIPNWFNSYQIMLNSLDFDLVYLATPPSTHEQFTMKLIEKRIHVFCEKPLAASLQSAKNMMELIADTDLVNAVHFGQNYLPGLNEFNRLVNNGYVGEVQTVSIKMNYTCLPPQWQKK